MALSMMLCACQSISVTSSEQSSIALIPILPDAHRNADEIVYDVGQGKKTPFEIRAQIQWTQSGFKTQAVNSPDDVASFRLYLLNGNLSPAQPVSGGGPFVLDLNPVLGSTYPKTKILVFKNVPDNPGYATYRVAAAAFDGVGGSGTNITGNGIASAGYLYLDEDGGGCPSGCQDAFVSIGGGNSTSDTGEIEIQPGPSYQVSTGHESPLLIFMTLD